MPSTIFSIISLHLHLLQFSTLLLCSVQPLMFHFLSNTVSLPLPNSNKTVLFSFTLLLEPLRCPVYPFIIFPIFFHIHISKVSVPSLSLKPVWQYTLHITFRLSPPYSQISKSCEMFPLFTWVMAVFVLISTSYFLCKLSLNSYHINICTFQVFHCHVRIVINSHNLIPIPINMLILLHFYIIHSKNKQLLL